MLLGRCHTQRITTGTTQCLATDISGFNATANIQCYTEQHNRECNDLHIVWRRLAMLRKLQLLLTPTHAYSCCSGWCYCLCSIVVVLASQSAEPISIESLGRLTLMFLTNTTQQTISTREIGFATGIKCQSKQHVVYCG
jgi:hypothetical protein